MFRIKPEPSVRNDSLWLMERLENQYCALDNCSQSFAKAGDKMNWEMEEWGRAVWHGRVKSAPLLVVICSLVGFHETGDRLVTHNTLSVTAISAEAQSR